MSSRKPRVLIVEDEPLVAMDIQMVLQDAGFDVVGWAATVEEALHLCSEHELNGALVDMNLNGQLTEAVVSKLLDDAVPAVVLTGYQSRTLSEPFCECPVINKPYEAEDVVTTLRLAMTRPPARRARRGSNAHNAQA